MSDKTGRSEKRKDWWGDEYIQHYDEDGNKTGTSIEKKDWWGDSYTEHWDQDGKRSGYSVEKETNWLQTSITTPTYTEHRDQDGKKSGHSVVETRFNDDPHTQYYDNSSRKTGSSEKERTWQGDPYIQHFGKTPTHKPKPDLSAEETIEAPSRECPSIEADDDEIYFESGGSSPSASQTRSTASRGAHRVVAQIETEEEKRLKEIKRMLTKLDGLDKEGLQALYLDPELKDYAIARVVMNENSNICTLAMMRSVTDVWGPESERRLNEIAALSPDHAERVALARGFGMVHLNYLQKSDPELHEELRQHKARIAQVEERERKWKEEEEERRRNLPPFVKFMNWLFGV